MKNWNNKKKHFLNRILPARNIPFELKPKIKPKSYTYQTKRELVNRRTSLVLFSFLMIKEKIHPNGAPVNRGTLTRVV